MKYCSNCGEQIDEKAVICVKCGVPVANNNNNTAFNQSVNVPEQGHGVATASLVLGIIGLIASVITIIIAIVIYMEYSTVDSISGYYSVLDSLEQSAKIGISILLTAIPGILCLIGLPLGCFCHRGGPKIAGIVLNTIALVICIIQVVIIMSI